jgi:polyphosphate kinase
MDEAPEQVQKTKAKVSELKPSTTASAPAAAKAVQQQEVAPKRRHISKQPAQFDLDAPELYLNRELTWLSFNQRVLHEAEDSRTPLLERVKFLAISSNNLDEFFMKRIGGLKHQVAAGVQQPTVDGRTPAQQIVECHAVIRRMQTAQESIYQELLSLLAQNDIRIVRYADLNSKQRDELRERYLNNIFPVVTPLAMDPAHPFPFISNLALNLLVTLRYPGGTTLHMARVKVPVSKDVAPRMLAVGSSHTFVTLDDVIANNLDLLFPGMEIESCDLFRVTRNANVEIDEEEADDLLEMIESELRERHFAPIVRLEVMTGMNPTHRGMLAAELGLDEEVDVFEVKGMMAMRDLFELASLDVADLHDPPHHPIDHPHLSDDRRNIFHILREHRALLLQHPYESFRTSVQRFLWTASKDPKVLAIKMTLYRTSPGGNVIKSLVDAARNGKQVVVLVELKARFDEAANIRWARRLEQAGIHVTYGVVGLKTHCKTILVVRKDYNGLRRYVHIGTGNYHADTARLYSDLGMLTTQEALGEDLTELFNYLTGYSPPLRYRKILVAPKTLKKTLLEKIDREIAHQSVSADGHIQFKANALEDADITKALYRASQAGVKIDLIVRDTCRLRPGIPGLSETVRIVSIVGRFLEHTRIYYFKNAGDEEYYIGSADLMKRNLEGRVEVLAPVEDPELRQDLRLLLDAQLSDRRSGWDMQSDGTYVQRQPLDGTDKRGCQEVLIGVAETRLAAAAKDKQSKVRKKLVNRFHKRLKTLDKH